MGKDTGKDKYVRWTPDINLDLLSKGHARQLGHLENYFVVCQRQGLYSNFNMYCELASVGNSTITKEQICSSLRYTVLENPILLTVLVEKYSDKSIYSTKEYLETTYEDDFDYMKIVNTLSLEDVLINLQPEYAYFNQRAKELLKNKDTGSECLFMELLNRLIIPYNDPCKPHWRLYWVEETNKLYFITDHIGFDGISSVNFFKDFIKNLNKENSLKQNGNFLFNYKNDSEKIDSLPLPAEKILEYKMRLAGLPRFITSEILKKYLLEKDPVALIPQIKYDSNTLMATNMNDIFTIRNMTSAQVGSFLKKCRSLKTKITPVLQACWLKSILEIGVFDHLHWNEWFTGVVITSDARYLSETSVENHISSKNRKDYNIGSLMAGVQYPYSINEIKTKTLLELIKSYDGSFEVAKRKGHYLEGLGVYMSPLVYKKTNIDKMLLDLHIFEGSCKGGTMIGNLGLIRENNKSHDDDDDDDIDDETTTTTQKNTNQAKTPNFSINDLKFVQGTGSFTKSYVINIVSTSTSGMNFTFAVDQRVLKNEDRAEFEKLVDIFFHNIDTFLKS